MPWVISINQGVINRRDGKSFGGRLLTRERKESETDWHDVVRKTMDILDWQESQWSPK